MIIRKQRPRGPSGPAFLMKSACVWIFCIIFYNKKSFSDFRCGFSREQSHRISGINLAAESNCWTFSWTFNCSKVCFYQSKDKLHFYLPHTMAGSPTHRPTNWPNNRRNFTILFIDEYLPDFSHLFARISKLRSNCNSLDLAEWTPKAAYF